MDWWAHVMWQRHGISIEVFLDWSKRKRLAYIASELIEDENPVRRDTMN
jgi:hypothetical protein